MYMDHMLQQNEKELETLIQTNRIYNQNIGMGFGIENFALLIIKSGKGQRTEGIELPNPEKIRTL